MTCKNCDASLNGKYCSNCGQKADIHPITLRHVAHDFIHAFTHADKGFLFTLKEMVRRPGYVAREYIEGKRKKYFNPLSFLVITMAIFSYLAYKAGYFETSGSRIAPGTVQTDGTSQGLSESQRMWLEVYRTIDNEGKIIGLFVVAPLIALLSWVFFRKPKHGFAEHFVLTAFMFGTVNVFRVVVIIPVMLVSGLPWQSIDPLFQLVFLIYICVTYQQLFHNRIFFTIVKSILVLALLILLFWVIIYGYVYVKHLIAGML